MDANSQGKHRPLPETESACVLGAGSWGTALACALAGKGIPVRMWGRNPERLSQMDRERVNRRYLPEAQFPEGLSVEPDIGAALEGAGLVVVAVPAAAVPDVCSLAAEIIGPEQVLVSATKGLEPEDGSAMTDLWVQALGEDARSRIVVLSGPNLARELVRGVPTVSVVACAFEPAARIVQQCFATSTYRLYTNDDVLGVELAGALKNVMAIGAGINDGLGFGDNSKAALVTRGLAEMVRLGKALGAREQTFYGLAGVGDLYATCASSLSRNWTVGNKLGLGETLEHVLSQMTQVAEGVPTARAGRLLAERAGVEMPILEQIYRVLYEGMPAREAVAQLMSRELKSEAAPSQPMRASATLPGFERRT